MYIYCIIYFVIYYLPVYKFYKFYMYIIKVFHMCLFEREIAYVRSVPVFISVSKSRHHSYYKTTL